MLNFTHDIPTVVYFGKGQVKALRPELEKRATKILVVTGKGSVKKHGIFDDVIKEIKSANVPYIELSGIQPNPRLASVYEGIEFSRENSVDFILAIGGGSVIDASKAIAAGVQYKGDVWDFFTGKTVIEDALPIGTVLTLAATGSEMNGNAVITKEDTSRKLHFSSKKTRPVFSVLDPEYTYSVDAYNTAAGVVDIMVHVFEQYFSHTENADVQDRMAEALLKVCVKYGPVVCRKPRDYAARANMLWAGSLALNNLIGEGKTEDWASHAIEHELSAYYDISHGAGLAIVTPNWMKHVLGGKTVKKFAEYGINVWGIKPSNNKKKTAETAIKKTRSFFNSLGMPARLRDINIPSDKFNLMAEGALRDWGAVGSFKKLSKKDIVGILKSSL